MRLTKKNKEKFLKNLLRFTAPGLSAVFAQLALGAEIEVALLTGLVVLYGAAADYFSKIK
ncbi:MAG: hypothetical protein ACTSYA_02370 [Candidatus Kariarchaeaceae archaeon]